MSFENTGLTMLNVFGIHISEVGIQNILSQLSDSLWDEYSSLLHFGNDVFRMCIPGYCDVICLSVLHAYIGGMPLFVFIKAHL